MLHAYHLTDVRNNNELLTYQIAVNAKSLSKTFNCVDFQECLLIGKMGAL